MRAWLCSHDATTPLSIQPNTQESSCCIETLHSLLADATLLQVRTILVVATTPRDEEVLFPPDVGRAAMDEILEFLCESWTVRATNVERFTKSALHVHVSRLA